MRKMRIAYSAFVVGLLLLPGACSHTVPLRGLDVVARTDDFVLTQGELAEWTAFLEKRRDFRRQLRETNNRNEEIARAAAVTAILLDDYGNLVSEAERRQLRRKKTDRMIRRTYVRQVLSPQVVIEEARVREIFDKHRENYQKARGVNVLEIFLWAPEDLADLRKEKKLLLESIRVRTTTPEAFRHAALEFSDATSAFRGGSIGTLLEDQVGGALQQALFADGGVLTEIVESPEGLFLFWIVRRISAKENNFGDVKEGIEAKLRQREMQTLIATDQEELRNLHAFVLVTNEDPSSKNTSVLRYDGKEFTLKDLDLQSWNIKAIERRGMAMLYVDVLQERGIKFEQPDQIEYDWILSRKILKRLIAQHPFEPEPAENRERPQASVERWTFNLLTIEGVNSPEALFAVFRAQYELGETADLENLRRLLEYEYGLHATITSFDNVLASSMADLGSEIHTTLKKHLQEGEISTPIHLMDQHQIVVIAFEDRKVDEPASHAAAESAAKKRSLQQLENLVVEKLLDAHGFQVICSEQPISAL